MRPRSFFALATAFVCFATPTLAQLESCGTTVETTPHTLLICPQGDGDIGPGLLITVLYAGEPVPNIPPCDFWLVDCALNGDVVLCGGSLSSNASTCTNENGQTIMYGPIAGSGCVDELALVIQGLVIGDPNQFCQTTLCLPIVTRSPDFNGDLQVTLSDVATFAAAWPPAPYGVCQDLNNDQIVNIQDLVLFANHYAHTCVVPNCPPGCP